MFADTAGKLVFHVFPALAAFARDLTLCLA
jgi:hypothetical protein